jgi:hypothetical protein
MTDLFYCEIKTTLFTADFNEAVNAEVPNSFSIEIKQEEFGLDESYQSTVILKPSNKCSIKQEDKESKSLEQKKAINVKKEEEEPQKRPSAISSK